MLPQEEAADIAAANFAAEGNSSKLTAALDGGSKRHSSEDVGKRVDEQALEETPEQVCSSPSTRFWCSCYPGLGVIPACLVSQPQQHG